MDEADTPTDDLPAAPADPFEGLPPMPGYSGERSPLPSAPLPPAAPPGSPDLPPPPPHIDADQLFTANTPLVQRSASSVPDPAAWEHVSGRPALRVRDLLADPHDALPPPPPPPPPPKRAEPTFFGPVTPEQLGEDPPAPRP